jgi:AraC-like DNA-binding protein
MYRIVGDIDARSFWLATTPSAEQLAQPYLCSEAGMLYGEGGFLTERDGKDSYLLFYTFGGTGFVRQGGRTVSVRHGQALLMDCRTPQSYGTAPDASHWHHFWCHVDGAGVRACATRLGLPALSPAYVHRSRMEPHFEEIFGRLEHESVENNERVALAVHALLAELTVASLTDRRAEEDPVRLACAFVERHYGERLAVEDLARAAHVSASHLTRLFRRSLGSSPHDYLVRTRITAAKRLLTETDLPIGRIAEQVGFASESAFSYRFSQASGISPRAYRKMTRLEQLHVAPGDSALDGTPSSAQG